ncbi:MAG: periplasmic heavy metal sensor [Burkholderiales bacterium]
MNQFALALVVSSALALPTAAQQRELPRQPPGHPMQGMMEGGGMMRMMGGGGDAAGRERPQLTLALQHRAQLGLTEAQGKMLEDLVKQFRGTAEKRVRELEVAETQLAALLKQDASAGAQVEAKVRAIEKLRVDLRLERIRTIAEGRATLDAEQRAKLDQIASQDRGMMGMRGGMEGMNH